MSEPPKSSPGARRLTFLLCAALLALALWTLSRGWTLSILDRHDFRQVQTALSIHWLKETGFKLAYETPIFGPPWSIPMEFPVYQAIVASISKTLGMGTESAGRLVSVGFFLASLPAVFLLARMLGLKGRRALWPVAAVLLAPLYLFYGRTVMIETTALGFSVWFLYLFARTVRDNQVGPALGATAFAVLAALAKVTTFIAFCPAAAAIAFWFWKPRWQRRHTGQSGWIQIPLLAALPVLVAGLVTVWWVGYADALKEANPFSQFLTSDAMSVWNWGTSDQRVSAVFWMEVWHSLTRYVLNEASFAALIIGLACTGGAHRRVAACCLALYLCGPLMFANLYRHHDYYFCANAVFLLAAAGVVLAGVWDNRQLPRALRLALPTVFFVGQYLGYVRDYWHYARFDLPPPPDIAQLIREVVPPDGVVLIHGWDWNGTVAYYSGRRTIQVRHGLQDDLEAIDRVLSQLPPPGVAAMLVNGPALRQSPDFIHLHTDRLGLAPDSIAVSEGGDLYLPQANILAVARRLRGREFDGVTLNLDAVGVAEAEPELVETDASSLALPFFSPKPVRARALHGFIPGESEGRPTLMAHPISELHFAAPTGAKTITAELGLYPQTYDPRESSVTDGVTFEIFERRPNGLRRTLFRRTLNPMENPADRGTQSIDLPAGPFEGALIFRTTPGPAGRFNNDWAYWGRIEIK